MVRRPGESDEDFRRRHVLMAWRLIEIMKIEHASQWPHSDFPLCKAAPRDLDELPSLESLQSQIAHFSSLQRSLAVMMVSHWLGAYDCDFGQD